ncbi:phage minor head protein [Paracoccus sp. (in: a-proteobacteria)]|uniref:phage minor head protein n=1 Tax=Paracoccus sp. TaxID=267 RepID=UPI0028A5A92E|nr:phage minor head protein [Paracoccus sp. (in: a-proteobacteria)]
MTRLPKDIQAALDRLGPAIRNAFLEAIEQITNAAQMNRLVAAIEAGMIEEAIEALRVEQGFFSPLNEAVRTAYLDGGAIVLAGLRLKDPYHGDSFVLGFDGRHDRAERWVRDRSSNLIVEVIDDQKAMARDVIRSGLEAGQNPRTVALDIVGRVDRTTGKRQGGFIGLTSQQASWAKNAERELRSLDANYFTRTRRDKRYDATVRAAIDSGKPIAEADIRRIITRYRDRLKKYRGDNIARTEALNSIRAGQFEGFEQLVESGRVRRDQISVTWSATMDSRTRDHHRHLNGQSVQFGGFFAPVPGVLMQYPGDLQHSNDPKALASQTINCRCIATYKVRSDLMR